MSVIHGLILNVFFRPKPEVTVKYIRNWKKSQIFDIFSLRGTISGLTNGPIPMTLFTNWWQFYSRFILRRKRFKDSNSKKVRKCKFSAEKKTAKMATVQK